MTLVLQAVTMTLAFLAPARLPAPQQLPRLASAASCGSVRRAAAPPTMGVPKFFRWLSERFPQINQRISEGRRADDYIDNFYLDMNGIIHTCTHGDHIKPGSEPSQEEMIERIFEYTERLIRIARPRKVLYLAIDGVAPRAKMNQQRSRRYRAPREAAELAALLARQGVPPPSAPSFDSNCITPGTEFLHALGERYKRWIEEKMRTDPDWREGPTVVFSGADVIGEGEHKIMDFIRAGRRDGSFGEDVRHCMYGLDADLIMLSLVTHEPKFSLLRERQKFQKGRLAPRRRGQRGAEPRELQPSGVNDAKAVSAENSDDVDFVFMEVELLRSLLGSTLKPRTPFSRVGAPGAAKGEGRSAPAAAAAPAHAYDSARVVDDFVFMCMLVGNDFIPGLPHLDVADGALNLMLRTYTEMLPSLGGYLTEKARIDLPRFERFVRQLSRHEQQVFAKKKLARSGRFSPERRRGRGRPAAAAAASAAEADPRDYKREYYLQKLGMHPNDKEGRSALVHSYLEGLSWCLAYYHDGCASWDWCARRCRACSLDPPRRSRAPRPRPSRRYYPDFYAPLASDLVGLSEHRIVLERGTVFTPLSQLLSVLPPQSAALVPGPYQELMLSPASPVFDAYPARFELDQNGKRAEWEAIALLPFIDEARLLSAVRAIEESGQLTEAERARNAHGEDLYWLPAESASVDRAVAVGGQ